MEPERKVKRKAGAYEEPKGRMRKCEEVGQ